MRREVGSSVRPLALPKEVAAMAQTTVDVDRNLLFAVIALQDDMIDQTQFADVCAGWAVRLERPLAELLTERKWISAQDRTEIERKLERKLKKHKGDVRATLAAVAEIPARDMLQTIDQPNVRQTINSLPASPRGHVLVETLAPSAAQRDDLRYTLTRLHAEGGLGKIWVAHDTDLNREVALKEIKASAGASPEVSRRFLKEAQITGQLEHPNIIPVYELARRKEDDQPFYTMRFLRGQTLRDAIAEFHRRRAGKPADRLELQRQLLEPFVKVCQAIGYAHSRGVIHRDLKPENIVLGGHGEVIVLDWGLAKVIGQPDDESPVVQEPRISLSADAETMQTLGQAGTPAYMAPEQVEARSDLINTRTDVYGLGAILFEILTSHPPASGTTLGEVFRKIQAGMLPKAREVEPTVPRALEAVCAKALAHDMRQRYPRAEDLAEDVRRWLLDESVSVYRDPIGVRLTRWGRRHRTLATTLGALLVTAVVGLTVGVILIDRERGRTEAQRKIADKNRETAEEQRTIAEAQREAAKANAARALQNLRLAQDAADGLLGEVGDVELAEIPQMEPVRQRLLEKARAGYQQFLVEQGDDPKVRWGAVRAQVRLADIQALLGDVPKAEPTYNQAIADLERLTKQDPANSDYRRDLARALHGQGVLLKDANRFQQGEASLRRAIGLREELAKLPDANADDQQALADSRYQLGALLARTGTRRPQDEVAYRAALEVQQGLMKQYADRAEYRARLARYRNNLGMLQSAMGAVPDAQATFRDTLALLAPALEGPEKLPGPRWYYARASNNLGTLVRVSHRDEASQLLRRAQDLLKTLAVEFPSVPQYALELASVEYNLGLLGRPDHPEQALASYQEAARLFGSLARRFPGTPAYRMRLAVVQAGIADVQGQSHPAEAEAALAKALEDLSALLREYPGVSEYQRNAGRSHYLLARLLQERKPAEALRHAEEAGALLKQVLQAYPDSESDRRLLIEDHVALTLALIAAGRLTDAVTAAEQLPAIWPSDRESVLHAAGLLIRCGKAGDGKGQEDCCARAVGVLREAVRTGVIRSRSTLDLPVLDPLSERDDFKKLRESLAESIRGG
jgi:eukaryotic-like serine/threonine-protein kinase